MENYCHPTYAIHVFCLNLPSASRGSNDSTLKEHIGVAEMLGDNRKRLILIDDHILVRQDWSAC